MTEYTQYFIEREFPEGATKEQIEALSIARQNMEDSVFRFLPELLSCPEDVQNAFFKAVYDIKRRHRMN